MPIMGASQVLEIGSAVGVSSHYLFSKVNHITAVGKIIAMLRKAFKTNRTINHRLTKVLC